MYNNFLSEFQHSYSLRNGFQEVVVNRISLPMVATLRLPVLRPIRKLREFRDVVFEDVVFDNNSSVTPY